MMKHVCGLQGFDSMLGDVCDACHQPLDEILIGFGESPYKKEIVKAISEEIVNRLDAEIMAEIREKSWDDWVENPMFIPVDPNKISLYDSKYQTRSKTMFSDHAGESLSENETEIDEIEETISVKQFLNKLENFLDETLDESTRGNVFMAENGDGVSLNVVIGAAFADNADGEEINQINISVLPTDRSVLGSEGVSMANEDADFEDEDYDEDHEDDEIDFGGLPL